jgi:segregation and condensation protein B
MTEQELRPIIEALIYVSNEPISGKTLIELLGKEHQESIHAAIQQLVEEYQSSARGLEIKEIANGYKMATKPEHHDWVRKYLKHLTPPAKLSLAALETLAVIAYKQPITVPEIQEVRGVSAVSVLKTLLDKKFITTAGRKNVVGRPILYKTSKEFLIHFGLKSLDELPSLEEFEELARVSLAQEGTLPQAADDNVPAEERSAEDASLQDEPLESDLELSVNETKAGGVELPTPESESSEPKSLTTETT